MASNEKTSAQAAAIAQRAMQNPKSITPEEVQALAASVLNQSDRNQQGQPNSQNQRSDQQRSSGQQNPQQQRR